MSNVLYVIDGYLSSPDKVEVTLDLIRQLKVLDPTRKIMLINKFNNSWHIENEVDYYREYLDGFMVGYPPQEIIESKAYSVPYVYFDTYAGTLENWMPFVGVSDHVANVYNGFVFSIQEAKKLGYSKVFRIEYDMLFDENEFHEILNDINNFENQDYLIYGKRKEGKWANEKLSLIDVHFCGYSDRMLDSFTFINDDEEYWKLCQKVGYYGKWAEYLISMVFVYNTSDDMKGKINEGFIREKFTKSNFDRISSSGEWTDKWKDIPKVCKVDINGGHQPDDDRLIVFYLNKDYDKVNVEVVGTNGYYKNVTINNGSWMYDIINRSDNMVFMSKVTHNNGSETYVKKINNENYSSIRDRFILK